MTVSVEFCTELNKTTRDWYHAAERKAALLFTLDGAFITALTANLPHLAGNVVEKHRAVNRGFLAAGVVLASLLFAAASYFVGFVW